MRQAQPSSASCHQSKAKSPQVQVAGPGPCPHVESSFKNAWKQEPSNVNNLAVGIHVQRKGDMQRPNVTAVEYFPAVVKNTFICVVDPDAVPSGGLRKSLSDGGLCKSSEEQALFWLPSSTSSSSKAWSSAPDQADDKFDIVSSIASVDDSPEVPNESLERVRAGNDSRPTQHNEAQCPLPPASVDLQHIPLIVQQFHAETKTPIADLMEAHLTCDLSLVPRNYKTGALLSIGSIRHNEGGCSPCMFAMSKSCRKGFTCSFCHLRHREMKLRRYRPSKKARDKMKLAARRAEPSADPMPSSDDEEDAPFVSQSETLLFGHDGAQAHWSNPDNRAEQPVRHMMSPKPKT